MGVSDLNVAMVFKLLDQFSGPGQRLRQTMRGVQTSAQKMRQELGRKITSGFAADNLEAALARSEQRVVAARGRLMGAAALAAAVGAPIIKAGNFEERLIDFANLAEIGAERVAQLKAELNALRPETGQSNDQLLTGLETYVGKGMDLDDALAALRATGRAAKATRSAMDEMGASGFAVMDNMMVPPEELGRAFDIMALSGKEGSFELAAMARKFPEITAGARALKIEGLDGVASLSAALQIAMKAAGSEDQAATNMTNFLGKITAPDTVRKFRKFGVDVEQELRIALERGADPLEHMLLVIRKMTDGDPFKMGELFADKQVLDFLRAMIPNMEEYQRIKGEAFSADGVIDNDWESVMKGFNEAGRQLLGSISALMTTSGSVLPMLTELMQTATGVVDQMVAWTAANPELTETIVKGALGLVAFNLGVRAIGFGVAVMGGGLLRTASLFLKFDKAGRNVSAVARTLRFGGRSAKLFARSALGLTRLMGKPLRWLVTPLKWTARLVPAIPWRSLAKMLSWRTLIKPLAWSSRFIPAIKWGGIAARLGILGMTAGGWGKLITPLKWFARAGLRFIPVIGWAVMAAELGMLAWNLLIKPLGWDKYISAEGLRLAVEKLKGIWDWTMIVPPLYIGKHMWLFGKQLWDEGKPDEDNLMSQGNVHGQTVAPHMTDEEMREEGRRTAATSPEQAAFIQSLLDRNEALRAGGAGEVMAPVVEAIREGHAQFTAPETSPRPTRRPEPAPYVAEQPHVVVESTFESSPTVEMKVEIKTPITVVRDLAASGAEIARRTGQKAGAEVERAVRRGLDDAALAE